MRTSFRPAAVTLVVAIGLTASGCATDDPAPKPSTSTSAAPLFASDEEALAAAEEAYAAYLAVVDNVLHGGGMDTSKLADVAVSDALDQANEDALEFRTLMLHTEGSTSIRSIALQQNDSAARGSGEVVVAYVCEDASSVKLLDSIGVSQVDVNRPNITPFEVSFSKQDDSERLMVHSRVLWSGENPCG